MRPQNLPGTTYKVVTGCGPMYVICNEIDGQLKEVFIRLGSPGGCAMATTEAVGRLISKGLRAGLSPADIIGDLAGIGCQQPRIGDGPRSCMDAVAAIIKEHLEASK